MKSKKLLCILLSLLLIAASGSVSFAAINDNARLVLYAGEVKDGKYTVILAAENCLDLTTCDLTISYNADSVEFLPYKSYSHGEPMIDMLVFNNTEYNGFLSASNIMQAEGKIEIGFCFDDTLNPEAYDLDVDIENAQVLRFYFNVKDSSLDSIKLKLSGDASFSNRAKLVIDEEFAVTLPCNGTHTNKNFDLLCDKCGEAVAAPDGLVADFYIFGSYSYEFDGSEFALTGCCEPVKNVDFPAYIYGYPVTKINSTAFVQDLIVSINIPETVTDIPADIVFCENLESITVSADNLKFSSEDGVLFDKNKTTLIQYPSSKKNASYTIPEGVAAIRDGAFGECKYLKELKLPSTLVPDDMSSLGHKIYGCSKLSSVSVASGNKYFVCEDGVVYNEDKTGLLVYPCGKTDKAFVVPDSVLFIDNYAFYNNKYLEEVTMQEGLSSIGIFSFGVCTSLKKVTLPQIEMLSYGAFADCAAIKTVYYGGDMISWINWKQWTMDNHHLLNADVICAKGNGIVEEGNKEIKDYGENSILVMNNKTVEDLMSSLKRGVDSPVVVLDSKGQEIAYDAKLGTGMKIVIMNGDGDALIEKTVIVPCDIDGDAAVSAADARLALRASVKLENLDSAQNTAANVDGETTVSAMDARLILRASVGLEKTSQLFNSVPGLIV